MGNYREKREEKDKNRRYFDDRCPENILFSLFSL